MARYVVSGANRGLGLEFVKHLLARGERVIAGCRKPGQSQALNALAAAHPGHLHVLPLDATSERAIAGFAQEAAMVAERVDVLINNAGLLVSGEQFGNVTAKSLADSFAVNATAPLLLAQAFAPLLLAAAPGAKIASISSQLGSIERATEFRTVSYAMSKAALNMAMHRLAADLTPQGISVISLHPGWVQTDMGGTGANLTPAESVSGLLRVIDALTPEHSGGFLAYDGAPLPW
jgi:NAD(P)-dependent dehydrogenase (short-subunit alcohol dehydrogenase family)